jgi:hypothetical protein
MLFNSSLLRDIGEGRQFTVLALSCVWYEEKHPWNAGLYGKSTIIDSSKEQSLKNNS